jgi:hypothetical protein
MKDFTKKILIAAGFEKQVKNSKAGKCTWCGSTKVKPEDFKDELSKKEFGISGFCQKCQDETFC